MPHRSWQPGPGETDGLAPNETAAATGRSSRRRLSGLSTVTMIGLVILAVYVLMAIVGPWLVPDPLATNTAAAYSPPSWQHPFGTDKFGRDILARTVCSARLDILLGVTIALIAAVVGTLVGGITAFLGGWVDELAMRLTDVVLAFPGFVLALLLVTALGDSSVILVTAVAVAYVPQFIRLTRSEVLKQRLMTYVDGARLAGNSQLRVALRHVLPNSLGPSAAQLALVAGWSVLTVAGLAFIGVGVRPPTPEWGVMISDGSPDVMTGQWWTTLFPGSFLVIGVMAFHFASSQIGGRARG